MLVNGSSCPNGARLTIRVQSKEACIAAEFQLRLVRGTGFSGEKGSDLRSTRRFGEARNSDCPECRTQQTQYNGKSNTSKPAAKLVSRGTGPEGV